MSYLKIIGFAITALTATILFKRMKEEYALFISLVTSISLTLTAFMILEPVITYIGSIGETVQAENHAALIMKSAGIAVITGIASDLCKDSGETSLGNRLELCGKALILSLSLPLIKNVFDNCLALLG